MNLDSTLTDPSGYLTDSLLVAMPSLQDGCFDRTVIYVCAHNDNGAMGVIINRPLPAVQFGDVLTQLKIPHGLQIPELSVQFGGPVEVTRGFILHSDDKTYEDTLTHQAGISLSASLKVLEHLVDGTGPEKAILVLGCAGWSPGQLEAEIASGSWFVVPASRKLVFDTSNDSKWIQTAAVLGIDMGRVSSEIGHA